MRSIRASTKRLSGKRETSLNTGLFSDGDYVRPVDTLYREPEKEDVEEEGLSYDNLGYSSDTIDTAWMLCTMEIKNRTVQCFADTGASRNFMSRSLAAELELDVQPDDKLIQLEGGKMLKASGTVQCEILAGNFRTECSFILLDIRNNIILGKPFWRGHHVRPDYESGGIIAYRGRKIYTLTSAFAPRELEKEELRTIMVEERKIKKIAKSSDAIVVLYLLRELETSTKEGERQGTGDKELNEALGPLLHVFRTELPDGLPPQRWVDHEIDTGDARPVNRPTYELSVTQLEEQEKQVSELVKRGLVRPSTSSWGAPVIFIKKKTGD